MKKASASNILQARLLGFDTKLVNSKFYAKNTHFDMWFHAPYDFDVYCWGEEERADQIQVELDSQVVLWDREQIRQSSGHETGFDGFDLNEGYHTATLEDSPAFIRFPNLTLLQIISNALKGMERESLFGPMIKSLELKDSTRLARLTKVTETEKTSTL